MFVVGVILISNVSSNLSGTTLVCTPPEILVLFKNILESQLLGIQHAGRGHWHINIKVPKVFHFLT